MWCLLLEGCLINTKSEPYFPMGQLHLYIVPSRMGFSCKHGILEGAGLLFLSEKSGSTNFSLHWLVQLQSSKIYPRLTEECQKRTAFELFYVGTKCCFFHGLILDGMKSVHTQWNRVQFAPSCLWDFKLQELQTLLLTFISVDLLLQCTGRGLLRL